MCAFAGAVSDAAMTAFTDSALLGLMGDHKGGYGQMRCFGSLGYATTVFASGQLQVRRRASPASAGAATCSAN